MPIWPESHESKPCTDQRFINNIEYLYALARHWAILGRDTLLAQMLAKKQSDLCKYLLCLWGVWVELVLGVRHSLEYL